MKKLVKNVKIAAVAAAVIYCAAFVLQNSLSVFQPGYKGVEVILGKVTPKSFDSPVWHLPFIAEITPINIRQQVYNYQLDMKSFDQQYIGISGAINYSLVEDQVHRLYAKIGEDYEPVLLYPLLESALTQTIGKRSLEFVVRSQEMIQQAVLYIMNDQLDKVNLLTIQDLRLFSPTFNDEFQQAIEDKFIAEQIAKKAAFETRRVEEEALQMKKKLEAEAYGLKLRSEALKNPLIVQYEYAKAMGNWKGNLPNTLMVGEKAMLPIVPMNVNK